MPRKPPRPKLTHFLCLPLVTSTSRPQLESSLSQFIARAYDPRSEEPLAKNVVRPVGTLHLTLGVMSLTEDGRAREAVRFLEGLDIRSILKEMQVAEGRNADGAETEKGKGKDKQPQDVTVHCDSPAPHILLTPSPDTTSSKPAPLPPAATSSPEPLPPLTLDLHGLHPMHKPTATSILYASPISTNPTFPLLPFCQRLKNLFTGAGFLLPEDRELKLHATVVNTVYDRYGIGLSRRKAKPKRLDATRLMSEFKDTVWAKDVRVEKVAICKMGAEWGAVEEGELGYKEVGSLSLLD